MKKALIIIASILIVISVGVYEGIDYFGKKAFNVLIESVNPTNMDPELLKKIDEAVLTTPIPSEEPKASGEAPKGVAANSNDQQKPTETVKETPKPVKKEVTFDDKAKAIALVQSKLSAGEIASLQAKVARGLTSQEITEIKSLVKSRFSAQEISQIKQWYTKYR